MKKLISVLLTLSLFSSLLCSCKREEGEGSTDPSNNIPEIEGDEENQVETVSLDGKKIIFIGNSYTYYGKTVIEKTQSVRSQEARSNDRGYFYEICKQNGAEVSVTNWTYGGHSFSDMFETCEANRGCDGAKHFDDLTDRNFDYVVFQNGSRSKNSSEIVSDYQKIMDIFKAENPDVKFVFLVQHAVHFDSYAWRNDIKNFETLGVTVVDWGALVCDIINGDVLVPGAKQSYVKNSFIISKSASDGFHPNMLTGYITALMTYCAITGESAVGQDYSFCGDKNVNKEFDFTKFINKYYTYNGATTNFPEIFSSPDDMKGIQELIDRYIKARPYLQYN
ncbi:MAG: hypothetical protein E7626_02120 [Ruminococcaceae bacterium]|nr:hypothetical protein [Oscillospiraceae bacterium]